MEESELSQSRQLEDSEPQIPTAHLIGRRGFLGFAGTVVAAPLIVSCIDLRIPTPTETPPSTVTPRPTIRPTATPILSLDQDQREEMIFRIAELKKALEEFVNPNMLTEDNRTYLKRLTELNDAGLAKFYKESRTEYVNSGSWRLWLGPNFPAEAPIYSYSLSIETSYGYAEGLVSETKLRLSPGRVKSLDEFPASLREFFYWEGAELAQFALPSSALQPLAHFYFKLPDDMLWNLIAEPIYPFDNSDNSYFPHGIRGIHISSKGRLSVVEVNRNARALYSITEPFHVTTYSR